MKAYKKDHLESYTAGVFVTLELLNHHLEDCTRVILHSKGMKNQGVQKILAICEASHIPYEINDRQTEKLSHKENCYAIGVFRKYPCQLMPGKNHVVLVNPGDMGNLGTIMRTMVGFGMEDLAIIRPVSMPMILKSSVLRWDLFFICVLLILMTLRPTSSNIPQGLLSDAQGGNQFSENAIRNAYALVLEMSPAVCRMNFYNMGKVCSFIIPTRLIR